MVPVHVDMVLYTVPVHVDMVPGEYGYRATTRKATVGTWYSTQSTGNLRMIPIGTVQLYLLVGVHVVGYHVNTIYNLLQHRYEKSFCEITI